MSDEYTKARDAAASEYANNWPPFEHHFKAGADWGRAYRGPAINNMIAFLENLEAFLATDKQCAIERASALVVNFYAERARARGRHE